MKLAELNIQHLKQSMNDLHKIAITERSQELAAIYGTILGCIEILTDCEIEFREKESSNV